jgi:hypothetical protein
MIDDLKIDTAYIAYAIKENKLYVQHADSLLAHFDKSKYNQEIKEIIRLAFLSCSPLEVVNFRKRTITELKETEAPDS